MSFSVQPELIELANRPPNKVQGRAVIFMLALGVFGFVGFYPFVEAPVSPAAGIIAIQSAGLAIVHFLIALLLLGQLELRRSTAVALLASGFLMSSIAACAYTLLFPQIISIYPLTHYSHANDWLYISWHGMLSTCVLAYALTSQTPSARLPWQQATLLLAILLSMLVALNAGLDRYVPALAADARTGAAYATGIRAAITITVLALGALLVKRRRTLLDLWLSVGMLSWLCDITLASSFDSESFDLGLYVGRLCSLSGSLLVLGVLGIENLRVHARLRSAFDDMIEARARQKSNDLLAAVLRQLPEGVFVFDAHNDRPIVNERGMAFVKRGMSGKTLNLAGPDVMALVTAQAARAARDGAFEDQIMGWGEGDEQRLFSVSAAPILGDDSGVAKVVVINDVTERVQAEQAQREHLERLHALLENTPLAAIEWGRDRIVRRWSKRAEELFGWAADDVVGKPIGTLGFIHPDDARTVEEMANTLVHSNVNYIKGENRNVTRDRRVLHCEWHNSALRNAQGDVDAVFSLALDITERNQAMRELREADQRKDVFIATLAHELRNPLAPIANASSLLLSQRADHERVEWIASMISRQSARMGRLLDDLLDVSRISRGKIELRREPVEMSSLVQEALQVSRPLVEAGHHHVDVDLPGEPVWIEADPVRIAQIMSNLMNNAAKYTPPGGRIEVRLAVTGDGIVFSVRDNGIGIEPDMLAHVFESFVQVGSARHLAQGGLGIGLSLAHGLAALHGGSLEVASEGLGQGSTFTLRLPLPGEDMSPAGQGHASDMPLPALQTSILVADDNVDAVDSLALLLRARGARVLVAYDGEQALQRFRDDPTDVVILDLGMPGIDGLTVASELAQADPRPFLIALTGRGRKEDESASLRAGFNEHLVKPVDLDRLGLILQQAVNRTK
ncbi:ATP-binding protein [Massilia sp. TN1-12]|uniref:ATP-binding protein n=1 Tax=Massilia paldalensis TaxID=3377675 RepID=UPI00384EA249